jgi:hypothetical protein
VAAHAAPVWIGFSAQPDGHRAPAALPRADDGRGARADHDGRAARDRSRVAFVGTRAPTGPPDCGESHCPAFALYVSKLSGGRQKVTNDTGPRAGRPDGKTIVFVARGALAINVLDGSKTTIHPPQSQKAALSRR